MPPYGVRRECGGNRRPARAAASRPYAALSIRSVGRGAHTPPNQAHSHRAPPPLHLVGAASSRPNRTPRNRQACRERNPAMAARGHAALRPQRPANCLAHGGWRADVGIGPYEKTESGSVGADGGMRSADCLAHGRPADAPYGERNHRTPARNGNWFRAAIQAAPTRGAGIRPDSGPFRSDGAQSADGARWTSRWSPHSR